MAIQLIEMILSRRDPIDILNLIKRPVISQEAINSIHQLLMEIVTSKKDFALFQASNQFKESLRRAHTT